MYKSLQACRAVAAILVVLFHLGGTFGQAKYFGYSGPGLLFGWGDSGVDFFFVLSGFLIATVHREDFGHPGSLPSYVFKRLVRIYPTYWLIAAAVCMAALVVPSLRPALPSDPVVFSKGFALIPQSPDVAGATGQPILFVAWSLQYELLFYAVIGCFILNRGLGLFVTVVLVAANLACRLGPDPVFPASFFASSMLYLFTMGVAAAWMVRSRLRWPRPLVIAALAAIGFVAFGAFEMHVGHDAVPVDRHLVFGSLAAVLIATLAQAENEGALVMRWRWPSLLGDASYALYLLHIPIISILAKVFSGRGLHGPLALDALFVAITLGCIGLSVLFYLSVERPMLNALRSFYRQRSHVGGSVVATHGNRP